VGGLDYLDRGYANLEAKLAAVGACLQRVPADNALLQAA
jgi:UDP-N-acetylglucosamine enolpyruvyl transferase